MPVPPMFLRSLAACVLSFAALFAVASAGAQQQADDADIERLLQASRAQSQLGNLLPQLDASQRQQFAQITAGKALDAQQQAELDRIQAQTSDALHQALSWEQLKPLYMDVYRRNFSRDDIRAIAKFYESEAGRHLLDRNPVLMQGLMQAIQDKLGPTLADLETQLQKVVETPAPPVSPPQQARPQPAKASKSKAKASTKKKASSSKKAPAKKPAAAAKKKAK